MSNSLNLLKQDNHCTNLMNYQERHKLALIENSYSILPERYFQFLAILTSRIHPNTYLNYPSDQSSYPVSKAYREDTYPLNTAAFNLTRYYEQDLNMNFLKENTKNILSEFQELTGQVLNLYPHNYSRRGKEDLLLVCYPGKIEKDGWCSSYPHNENNTKAKFFSFLWHKGLITEGQLYQSNAMLGTQHQEILAYKETLAKTGTFIL